MSLRVVLFATGILLAGALLVVGAAGAIEFLVNDQCGASGYLCKSPTANISNKGN
jgi:hypothetical protein